jgi:hypothetical protein
LIDHWGNGDLAQVVLTGATPMADVDCCVVTERRAAVLYGFVYGTIRSGGRAAHEVCIKPTFADGD